MPWYTAAPPGDEPSTHLGHVSQGRIRTRCSLSFARDEARRVGGGPRDRPDGACRWCLAGQPYPLPEESRPRHRLGRRRPRRRAATLAGVLTTITVVTVVVGVAAVVLAVVGVVALWVLG